MKALFRNKQILLCQTFWLKQKGCKSATWNTGWTCCCVIPSQVLPFWNKLNQQFFACKIFVKLSEILNSCSVFLQQPNLTCCVYCMLSHMSSFLSAQLSCSRCGRVGFPQTIFMRIRKVALGSNFGFTYFTLKFYIVVQCFQLTFLVGLASTPITGDAL